MGTARCDERQELDGQQEVTYQSRVYRYSSSSVADPAEGNRDGSHMRGILLRWLVSIKAVRNYHLLVHYAGVLQAYNYTSEDSFEPVGNSD